MTRTTTRLTRLRDALLPARTAPAAPVGIEPVASSRYWTLVPCAPSVSPDNRWIAACAMTEGNGDDEHSHWLSPEGVETITRHTPGERTAPNCYIRTRAN